jgi:hypothetical protein
MADVRRIISDLAHILVFLALVGILLGVLTWTGIVKCGAIPFWCDIYWGAVSFATGGPKVLIVYGDYGLGNPIGGCNEKGCSLRELLANPEFVGVRADTIHIDRVNSGNLRPYHLVIVERAKKIPTKTLEAFIDYYNAGGRLVWTGDAGTELAEGDHYLYRDERNADTNDHIVIGPWSRKKDDKMISFDYLLSVNYKANYCDIVNCSAEKPVYAGSLQPEPSRKHPLVRGMAAELPLWVFKGEDFAVVETLSGGITTEVLTLDYKTRLGGKDANYGRTNPMIVASGIGERVVYYAMPPELFANPKLERFDKGAYLLPLENMYYAIMWG